MLMIVTYGYTLYRYITKAQPLNNNNKLDLE